MDQYKLQAITSPNFNVPVYNQKAGCAGWCWEPPRKQYGSIGIPIPSVWCKVQHDGHHRSPGKLGKLAEDQLPSPPISEIFFRHASQLETAS